MALLNNNGFAMCEIGDHTWVAPPRPPDCHGGWGDRIGINQGGAPALSCHTDNLRGSVEPTLNYGDKWSVHSITCDSEPSGMTCTDAGTGHFFRIARDSYGLY